MTAVALQAGEFTEGLRHWRRVRKMTQLELALAAEVSQRHISWLETGRSQPSREMVLRLSEAMDVPLRERNRILNSAGYASLYQESRLDEPSMAVVTEALTGILDHHNPYPAIVLDRCWNIQMMNDAAGWLFSQAGDPAQMWDNVGDTGERNMALLTVHPNGLRHFIVNWDVVIGPFMQRLKREAIDSADSELLERYRQLEQYVDASEQPSTETLLPILPLQLVLGEVRLSVCSVISAFGTTQDITATELRIETFYPTDAASKAFFSGVSKCE
jgi:transcriptional regulator with XRE-family HTH domain